MENNFSEKLYASLRLVRLQLLEMKIKNNEDLIICKNGIILKRNPKEVLEELRLKGEL